MKPARYLSRDAAPQSEPTIDIALAERLRMLPRFCVMLHNDDFHDMDHVVRALLYTVLTLNIDEAVRIMLRAHTHGVAIVTTCPRETAEFYRDGLQRFGLTCTVEPA
jgi:ATP-dependent Clp protease adaptor protein ClpS